MKKQILSITLTIILIINSLLFVSIAANAYEDDLEDEWTAYYEMMIYQKEGASDCSYKELDDGTLEITTCGEYIPYAIDGKIVTRIGERAGWRMYDPITVIEIPASVTYIADDAFGYCFTDGDGDGTDYISGWYKYDDIHIFCYANTAGEQYAVDHGYEYTILTPKYGDVNFDGFINMLDVLFARKYIAKQPIVLNTQNCDVNCDNQINMLDVLFMRKYIAKQPVVLGPQKQTDI